MAQRYKPTAVGQHADQQPVTLQTSLQQVKVLLESGIGCIAFLRGLLPEDSFEDYKLLAPRAVPSRSSNAPAMTDAEKAKNNTPSSVRVKKLKRGSSVEADKLLDYLELGVTEAIKEGYLQQLIFAIYLDPDQPTNLVESYTFTLTYETDAMGMKRPELVVQDQLKGMVISSTSGLGTKETPRGEGDVKRQVQQMIKNLITSTQVLDELPRRRFLNLRLFYTKDTPAEYEPPCFRPVPADSPGYTLMTPSVADQPDFGTLGTVSTGYHGIALHSVSIAHVLDTPFDERITSDEALARNRFDAASRPVIWNAESLVESATDEDAKLKSIEPIAVRDLRGGLHTIQEVNEEPDSDLLDLGKRIGIKPNEAAVVTGQGMVDETLLDSNLSDNTVLRRAIALTEKRAPSAGLLPTQLDPAVSRERSLAPPVPLFEECAAQSEERIASQGEIQQLPIAGPSYAVSFEDNARSAEAVKVLVPPADTQLLEYSLMDVDSDLASKKEDDKTTFGTEPDTLQTHATIVKSDAANLNVGSSVHSERPHRRSTPGKMKMTEDGCECGDKEDDDAMLCCSSCEVWKHGACYGFEGVEDARIPEIFECYRCLAHAALQDSIHDSEREGEIEQALADFRSLALFRRAVDVIWGEGVLSMGQLATRLAVDNATAAQVLKRMKAEEYVLEQAGTRRRPHRKNASQATSSKTGGLAVNRATKQLKHKKAEYFDPGAGAEKNVAAVLRRSPKNSTEHAPAPAPISETAGCINSSRPSTMLTLPLQAAPAFAEDTTLIRPAALVDDKLSSALVPCASATAIVPAASPVDPIVEDSQPKYWSAPDTIVSAASSTPYAAAGASATERFSLQTEHNNSPVRSASPVGTSARSAVTTSEHNEHPHTPHAPGHIAGLEHAACGSDSMQVDRPVDPQTSGSSPPRLIPNKRLSGDSLPFAERDQELGVDALLRRKRQKCSEASEIEV